MFKFKTNFNIYIAENASLSEQLKIIPEAVFNI